MPTCQSLWLTPRSKRDCNTLVPLMMDESVQRQERTADRPMVASINEIRGRGGRDNLGDRNGSFESRRVDGIGRDSDLNRRSGSGKSTYTGCKGRRETIGSGLPAPLRRLRPKHKIVVAFMIMASWLLVVGTAIALGITTNWR